MGRQDKMILNYIIDLLSKERAEEANWEPQPLYIEDIHPDDLPPDDRPFPKPLPNKRVIIMDL